MAKADIVLIPFPFNNLSDTKIRPCLVLIDGEYDVTVAFITTQTGWNNVGSVPIKSSPSNGLRKESLVRLNKVATIDKDLILGKIGILDSNEKKAINQKLKELYSI
ncbi:MAG: type II toxin-antitoxin system PemK/MazF family toxin [Bacteroidota bacterium]|nr:type II toxin-antitoxin system PemK/MazF family toxin [Bacteroidota bacterium]